MQKVSKTISVVVLCWMGLIFSGCSDLPKADPNELWGYLTQAKSSYKNWAQWPDHQGMQEGRAPHGPLHKIFINDKAANSNTPPVQYGSIVVKENYDKKKILKAITVMYKVKNYNPKDGDWFWTKYTPQGKAEKFGKPEGCIGCHGTRAQNDFILVHEFTKKSTPGDSATAPKTPDATVLWQKITATSPYQKWMFWPDHQGMQKGRAPHGTQHKVFVNDLALNSKKPPLQYGSICVKENFDNNNVLKAITVMQKIKGYAPENGDWFWVKYAPDGKVEKAGTPTGCIGCHGTRAKNDFLLVHEFR